LCHGSGGGVDDRLVAVIVIIEYGKDRCDDRLGENKLLLFKSARVNAAFGIERENGKRVPNAPLMQGAEPWVFLAERF
jgi:hypothetical protein